MIRVMHSVSNMDRAGIETMLMNYYRHIDRERVQFDFWANKQKPGDYEAEIERLGGRVFRSPGYYPQRFPRYVRQMKKIVRGEKPVQIVHVHNEALGLYALVAAKMAGARTVYHAHNTFVARDKVYPVRALLRRLIPLFTDHRLACGREAARFYYGEKCIARGDYMVLNNAVELPRFVFNEQTREALRREKGMGGRLVIGHVGRFCRQKNHDALIDIFAAVKKKRPDALLVLLGEGELMEKIREKIAALGLKNDVLMPGSVPDVNRWYQAFDAFVMPSFAEGLPVVGVEALAAGLPCFFSDTITRELALSDTAHFLPLSAPADSWADEILSPAAPRRDMTDVMRAAGYDIESEAGKLQAFYERIAAQRK